MKQKKSKEYSYSLIFKSTDSKGDIEDALDDFMHNINVDTTSMNYVTEVSKKLTEEIKANFYK